MKYPVITGLRVALSLMLTSFFLLSTVSASNAQLDVQRQLISRARAQDSFGSAGATAPTASPSISSTPTPAVASSNISATNTGVSTAINPTLSIVDPTIGAVPPSATTGISSGNGISSSDATLLSTPLSITPVVATPISTVQPAGSTPLVQTQQVASSTPAAITQPIASIATDRASNIAPINPSPTPTIETPIVSTGLPQTPQAGTISWAGAPSVSIPSNNAAATIAGLGNTITRNTETSPMSSTPTAIISPATPTTPITSSSTPSTLAMPVAPSISAQPTNLIAVAPVRPSFPVMAPSDVSSPAIPVSAITKPGDNNGVMMAQNSPSLGAIPLIGTQLDQVSTYPPVASPSVEPHLDLNDRIKQLYNTMEAAQRGSNVQGQLYDADTYASFGASLVNIFNEAVTTESYMVQLLNVATTTPLLNADQRAYVQQVMIPNLDQIDEHTKPIKEDKKNSKSDKKKRSQVSITGTLKTPEATPIIPAKSKKSKKKRAKKRAQSSTTETSTIPSTQPPSTSSSSSEKNQKSKDTHSKKKLKKKTPKPKAVPLEPVQSPAL